VTYTKSGSFGFAGGGKSGAIVDLWAASRFGSLPPAEDQAPPSGSPDAGPVTTSTVDGNPGAFYITGITVVQDYWIRVQYGGKTYWGGCPAATLGGVTTGGSFPTHTGSGSPQGVVTAAAIGETYQDTAHGGIWVASGTGNNHWFQLGGQKPATGTLTGGVFEDAPSNASTIVVAEPSANAALSDVAAQGGTSNGVYWAASASDGTQDFSVQVGSSGQFVLIFSHLGVLNVPAALVLSGIPTSNPGGSGIVWNNGGVLNIT
jgi:hypothetical protein